MGTASIHRPEPPDLGTRGRSVLERKDGPSPHNCSDHDGADDKKGFLTRKKIDNVFHYSPKQPLSEVLKNLVGDFVNGVLGGSVVPLAAYLTQSQPLKAEEIEQLKKLVQRLEADTSALARKRGKSK